MTVDELIAVLKQCPGNLKVRVNGTYKIHDIVELVLSESLMDKDSDHDTDKYVVIISKAKDYGKK